MSRYQVLSRQWGNVPFSKNFSGLNYLMPESPLFGIIQRKFHEFYVEEYGNISHFYSFDTFNEMSPPSENLNFLQSYGKNIIKRLKEIDSKAIWVMQGNSFLSRAKLCSRSLEVLGLAFLRKPTYPFPQILQYSVMF